MHILSKFYACFAALAGFAAMLMGATAAHKARDPYAADLLREASYYQLAHVLALLVICRKKDWPARAACSLFAAGMLFFCGGLCLKALSGVSLGPLVPIGGGALMLGWLALAFHPFARDRP